MDTYWLGPRGGFRLQVGGCGGGSAGRLVGWKVGRMGGWEVGGWVVGGWEIERLSEWEVGRWEVERFKGGGQVTRFTLLDLCTFLSHVSHLFLFLVNQGSETECVYLRNYSFLTQCTLNVQSHSFFQNHKMFMFLASSLPTPSPLLTLHTILRLYEITPRSHLGHLTASTKSMSLYSISTASVTSANSMTSESV